MTKLYHKAGREDDMGAATGSTPLIRLCGGLRAGTLVEIFLDRLKPCASAASQRLSANRIATQEAT